MEIFCIFYGLIEFLNSIYVHKDDKNNYDLYTTCIWGLSFIFIGSIEILNLIALKDYARVLFGITWFPMIFTSCGIKILRINKAMIFVRKTIFLIIGISQFFL